LFRALRSSKHHLKAKLHTYHSQDNNQLYTFTQSTMCSKEEELARDAKKLEVSILEYLLMSC